MDKNITETIDNELKLLPRIVCPVCADNAHVYNLQFMCCNCKSSFDVNVNAIDNCGGYFDVEKSNIKLSDFSNISKAGNTQSKDDSIHLTLSEDNMKKLLAFSKKYKLGDISDAARIFIDTAIDVASMIESKTDYVGFIDSSNNKSFDLRNGKLFESAKKEFLARKATSLLVSNFIDDMHRSFIVNDINKYYSKEQD